MVYGNVNPHKWSPETANRAGWVITRWLLSTSNQPIEACLSVHSELIQGSRSWGIDIKLKRFAQLLTYLPAQIHLCDPQGPKHDIHLTLLLGLTFSETTKLLYSLSTLRHIMSQPSTVHPLWQIWSPLNLFPLETIFQVIWTLPHEAYFLKKSVKNLFLTKIFGHPFNTIINRQIYCYQ